uniref:G_PROTEIN_RECEP_F1_2 domain-containing protein n=1 Tax=Bursaphelenchus xylophilus TaxID=6326 RepID=A0A1I7RZW0_BURXY
MGSPFAKLGYVYFLYLPSTIGTYLGPSLMLTIALDRLFCVLFPMTYNEVNRTAYLFVMLAGPLINVALIVYWCYQYTMENADTVVVCIFSQIRMKTNSSVSAYLQLIICISTMLCYAIIWSFLLNRDRGSVTKTVKPLSLVTFSEVLGWFIALIMQYTMGKTGLTDPVFGFALLMNAGWIVSFGVTSNYFAYFVLKYELRNTKLYFLIMIASPLVYTVAVLHICYTGVVKDKRMVVVRLFAQTYVGPAAEMWFYLNATFCVSIVFCYVIIWSFLVKRYKSALGKTIKPLSIIALSDILGWSLSVIIKSIYDNRSNPSYSFVLQMNSGWLIHLGIASNYFVYYLLNKEYRQAFLEQLNYLSCNHFDYFKSTMTTSINQGNTSELDKRVSGI